jgi:hypothetical protein
MDNDKKYMGSCYIGVVGADLEYGECHETITNIYRRPGDEGPLFLRATKGFEARQTHLNNWFSKTGHAFLLLLDSDMTFPTDTLERLRRHELPFVSGLYLRRRYAPLVPVWFKPGPRGIVFQEPFMDVPERGKLYELGASGWGCMLIHRDVVTATKPILKGEPEILEDDMDIWPYDIPAVLDAIKGLREIAKIKPPSSVGYPALEHHLSTLEREIRVLSGDKQIINGSDVRYPFFAHEAGFQLMGDPDVRCGHELNYPIHPNDYDVQPKEIIQTTVQESIHQQIEKLRDDTQEKIMALNGEAK